MTSPLDISEYVTKERKDIKEELEDSLELAETEQEITGAFAFALGRADALLIMAAAELAMQDPSFGLKAVDGSRSSLDDALGQGRN
jgi:hypothetical protein